MSRAERRAAVAAAVERQAAAGVCWAEWARAHGFSRHAVRHVVRGRGPCVRGEAFRIAAALGALPLDPMPVPVPAPGARRPAARLERLLRLSAAALQSVLVEWECGAEEDYAACDQLATALETRNWPKVEAALRVIARGAGEPAEEGAA